MTGAELRARRVAAGLSQEALAAHLGVTRWRLWGWESGLYVIPPRYLAALPADHPAAPGAAARLRRGRQPKQPTVTAAMDAAYRAARARPAVAYVCLMCGHDQAGPGRCARCGSRNVFAEPVVTTARDSGDGGGRMGRAAA